MKPVYVVLAFHAHEPLWDFPGQLQALADREEIRQGVTSGNYLRKRQREGRNIYLELLAMGRRMRAPLCLEASNELLFQIQSIMPETFTHLQKGFTDGTLHPILGHAHHTHISLLHEGEIVDELRLNAEYYKEIIGIDLPKTSGAFPTEDSIDAHKLGAYQEAGVKYLIFPHLHPAKCAYRLFDQYKNPWSEKNEYTAFTHRPFSIGHGLLALPRNFPISQYIWKPITRLRPQPLRSQGYLLGDYPVFAEEYRNEEQVTFPIDKTEAVEEYTAVLQRELEKAPDHGLLLYIQDLELMDFGELALEIMEAAWERLRDKGEWDIRFTTPETYLKDQGFLENQQQLPAIEFDQISWAPEIRPVLRADGHYPPLDSGKIDGVDVIKEYLHNWPLAFWETGRYFVMLTNYLLEQAGFDLTLSLSAQELNKEEYNPSLFSVEDRLRLLGRLMKRGCNWGWRPDEARQKRPLAALYLICQELADEDAFKTVVRQDITKNDRAEICSGLKELNKVFLTYRWEYLKNGLQNLGWLTEEQENRIERVKRLKKEADRVVDKIATETEENDFTLARLTILLKEYCRHLFLGTELLQEIWAEAPEADRLVTEMYHYLYKQVPPRFLQYLKTYYGENRPEDRIGLRPAPVRQKEPALV